MGLWREGCQYSNCRFFIWRQLVEGTSFHAAALWLAQVLLIMVSPSLICLAFHSWHEDSLRLLHVLFQSPGRAGWITYSHFQRRQEVKCNSTEEQWWEMAPRAFSTSAFNAETVLEKASGGLCHQCAGLSVTFAPCPISTQFSSTKLVQQEQRAWKKNPS